MDETRRDNPKPRLSVGADADRPLRFALTGTFHSLNRGDSAMQLAAATALRERWPRAQIAIHTPYPDDDRALYEELEVVACSRRRPLTGLKALAQASLWHATGRRAPLSPELWSYRNACAVIDLSGDGLTETFGWQCPVSHTVPLLLAYLMKTPFCLMAQTIGPFGLLRPWFRWVFRRAAFITARDEETFRYLADWNLPCPVEQTADLAFLLEPVAADEAKQCLRSLGHFDAARPLIGVTPSTLYNVQTEQRENGHFAMQEYAPHVAAACQTLAREVAAQILIVPHVFGPGERYDDRRAAESLAALIKSPTPEPLVIQDPLTPPQLKAIIGCCDLFIGMRMHSVIAAVSQSVPTLALAYSPKLVGLMNRLGQKRFVLPCDQLNEARVTHLAQDLWAMRSAVRAALGQKLREDILPAARRNLDALDRYIAAGK